MIKLTGMLWIGQSSDGYKPEESGIRAAINVAQDLRGWCGWPEVEYMQVGLIDGPGNTLHAYAAAAIAVKVLLDRRKGPVLVFCHGGGRSLAVALMYFHLTGGHDWNNLLAMLRERVDEELPPINECHRVACSKIDWRLLARLLED